tara:strand:- start:18609 stop:19418 length:810 start_codon:yes stop_codon:yes gene_type:complete
MNTSAPAKIEPRLKPPQFRSIRTIIALMLREMGATYGASPGGYIWAIVQPVGMLVVLSIGFSLLVRSPSLGTSFFLFYATGYLPFQFYNDIASKVAFSLRYARALLAYPSVTWVDAVLARFILNVLTQGIVFGIVISGIFIVTDPRTILDLIPIISGISLACLLGFGVGLMNATLGGLFPIWNNFWQIVSRPLFLASGIFFIYEDLPSTVQNILWWNPVMHVTGLVRTGFYPTYQASYVSLSYGFGVALVMIALGLVLMRANYTKVLER